MRTWLEEPPLIFSVRDLIAKWEPPKAPHCSNCRNAKVRGAASMPIVTCAKGQGEKELIRMIRHHGVGFRNAATCADYEAADG